MGKIKTDYEHTDIGCPLADKQLGHKSKCKECPFERCFKNEWSWPLKELRDSETVFNEWLKNGNIGKVAERLGMSVGTVRKYLQNYMFEGIRFYQACLAPDSEYQDLIKQYIILGFEEGKPVKQLAWNCNISYQYACRILKATGRRTRRGRPRKPS